MKYLDIADYIKKSDIKTLRRIPGFAIKIIEKIICQEPMNDIMTRFSDKLGADFLEAMIVELNLTPNVVGKENLPESGRCFFVANHPYGIVDGLLLTRIVSQKYGKLKAIGNDAFMFIPNLRPLIATVNVFGRNSKEYIKALEDLYMSDFPITHFPAGEVSRTYRGKIQDCAWQKSFITKAVEAKRDIVPFYIGGRNSRKFYFISALRRLLGIKLNFELLLLPREMFNKKNKTVKVIIGQPIPWQTFDNSLTRDEWAKRIRRHVYDMGQNDKPLNTLIR